LVWAELEPPPFWLDPATVVDMLLVGWCNCTSGMTPKVEWFEPSAMVERI
jgi:hypothetical protein